VQKVRTDRTDHKFWKKKHSSQEKRAAKAVSTKLAPGTYTPVTAGTFDSIRVDKARVPYHPFSLSPGGVTGPSRSGRAFVRR
jgi:hypothetical protein